MLRVTVMLLALSILPSGAPAAGAATDRPGRFDGEVAAFVARDAAVPPPRCATLFVGSSSIRLWPGLAADFAFPTIQRGVGGSTIAEIDRYFGRIVAPYQPSRIVLYAGENDLNEGKAPAEVLADLKRFMARKRGSLGATPVYFLSAKPSPARAADRTAQAVFNRMADRYAAREKDLVFIDVATPMMAGPAPRADLFGPDALHMVRPGYDIWTRTIRTALARPAPTRNRACAA